MVPFVFIVAIILIKLSLLGLGMLSILAAALCLFLQKSNLVKLPTLIANRFKKKFKFVITAHCSIYALFILKLFLVDGIEDVPGFIASHLILHHAVSAVVAGILTFSITRSYFHYKAIKN